MDWEAIGAIGETLAAIGVLISLVYLAIQIRQNNTWLRQQAFQLSTNEIRRWTGRFAQSESASALWLKRLRDFNGLNQTETFRFSMMVFESSQFPLRITNIAPATFWDYAEALKSK